MILAATRDKRLSPSNNRPLPTWIEHKHVALRPVDSPSRTGDLYFMAARLGGQHAKRVDLSKPVSLAKRTTLKADERVRSGL